MIIPWLIGAHNEIEGYDVHLSTISMNGGLCKDPQYPRLTRTRRRQRRKARFPRWPSPNGTQEGPGSGRTRPRGAYTGGSSSRCKRSSLKMHQSFESRSVRHEAIVEASRTHGDRKVHQAGQSSIPKRNSQVWWNE